MDTTTFTYRTGGGFAVVDLTRDVAAWLRGRGDGLCHVFVPHATAGLALIELGAGGEVDARTAPATSCPSS